MTAAAAPSLPFSLAPGMGDPDPPLPRLREDLALLPGPPAKDGSPTWTIHDPARDRYLRLGWRGMEMLTRWRLGAAGAVAKAVAAETTARVSADDVLALAHFLRANDLTASDDPAAVARLTRRHASRRTGLLTKAVHNYLFFRIPVIRPERFLRATQHLAAPFYSAAWRWVVGLALLAGLFLTSRQWDQFVAGAADLMSWDGAAALAATLAVVKTLHEFGHAYTARRYGCRVPTMGVAFLVMWPVLYTDTTHVYRLTSRRQRLAVAVGGIMVEMALAACATLAWALLPDGTLRTACHAAATVTWIGTLAINLNPFMRFDGYYLLADALDIPNLQDRAFAIGKWQLREALFGLGEEPPERFAPGLRRFLIAYAVAVWVYRFFLFLGIAVLVYEFAFKLLGIVLMGIEIGWFIALPILREMAAWWHRRAGMRLNRRAAVTLAGLAGVILAGALPWPWPVAAPAVRLPAAGTALHAPSPARVAALPAAEGTAVTAGQTVAVLEVPDLGFEAALVARRIAALEGMVERESALSDNADKLLTLRQELDSARTLARGLDALREELVLRAPIAGRVVDRADPLTVGQWVRPSETLMRVVDGNDNRVVAFVAAADLERVKVGADARFIGEDPAAAAMRLRVTAVDTAAVTTLDQPLLAGTLGGPLPVAPVAATRAAGMPGRTALQPLTAVYRVTLTPSGKGNGEGVGHGEEAARAIRGRVWIDGPPMGLIERAWRAAAAVLVRESGF